MAALPLVAFAVARVHGSPNLILGLVIVAASPGNVSSRLFTRLANGDVALSFALLAVSSLLSALSIPLTVNGASHLIAGSSAFARMPLGRIALSLFLLTTLPAMAGIAFRRLQPALAERLDRRFPLWGTAILLLLVAVVLHSEWGQVKDSVFRTGVVVALFNVLAVALAWCIARLCGVPASQQSAITMGCGLRNCGVAALISLTLLRNPELVVPAFAYALCMWFSAAIAILIAHGQTWNSGDVLICL
jgi:BASS family bile acid:Na+ symporter